MIAFFYPIFLIIICTIYAILTRKIPESFNESKHIGTYVCVSFGINIQFSALLFFDQEFVMVIDHTKQFLIISINFPSFSIKFQTTFTKITITQVSPCTQHALYGSLLCHYILPRHNIYI